MIMANARDADANFARAGRERAGEEERRTNHGDSRGGSGGGGGEKKIRFVPGLLVSKYIAGRAYRIYPDPDDGFRSIARNDARYPRADVTSGNYAIAPRRHCGREPVCARARALVHRRRSFNIRG